MIGLANHAGADGRGAYPSQGRLAWYARCSERTVRRHLVRAQEAGLIRPGDQRFVLHLPADKRPVVWDLPIHLKRDAPEPGGHPGRPRKVRAEAENPVDTGDHPNEFTGQAQSEKRADTGVRGDSGVQNGGTPEVNRADTGVLQTVLEPSFEPPPPTPSGSETATSLVGAEKAEEGEEGDDLEKRLASAVDAVQGQRPGWSRSKVLAAVRAALADGRDVEVALAALPIVAADPATVSPGRLNGDGPWWAAAERVVRKPAPPVRSAICDRHALRHPRGSECPRCTEEVSNAAQRVSEGAVRASEINPEAWAELSAAQRAQVEAYLGNPDGAWEWMPPQRRAEVEAYLGVSVGVVR